MSLETVEHGATSTRDPALFQAIMSGLLASFVGYASTVALVIQALSAVGATPSQVSSGLLALNVTQGLVAIALSLRLRMPITTAWCAPGAAVLATLTVPQGGFAAAVGAFFVSGALCVLAGAWPAFGRRVSAIPRSLANAMLAGIILNLCLAPITAIKQIPRLALPVVIVWIVVARFRRLLAVPAAAIVASILVVAQTSSLGTVGDPLPHFQFVRPLFSSAAIVSIGLPLFVVTMASQNIPGLAVLRANDYDPAPRTLFVTTGTASMIAAFFGGHALNVAAITAALCVGPDGHPKRERRYIAGVALGVGYVLFAMLSPFAVALVRVSPPLLIQAVAGLALLGALGSALANALEDPADRDAALVTLVGSAATVTFWGVGSAFWALLAGSAIHALHHAKRAA